jgi:hypothetical protein
MPCAGLSRYCPATRPQIAIAAVNDLIVVATNVRRFEPFSGIAVEDWRSD